MFEIAQAIQDAGLGSAEDFLKVATTDTALISVMVVNLWQNAPYVAVLLLAGLRSLLSKSTVFECGGGQRKTGTTG